MLKSININIKMGSKHPISLRLKTKQNWNDVSYYFNSKSRAYNYWGMDKITLNVIKHYFQFAILSKPRIYKNSNKIVITFYYFLNLPVLRLPLRGNLSSRSKTNDTRQGGNILPVEAKGYSKLILKLSKLYGRPVELRPVRIHYPYLNSYILAQYIALNIKRGKFNMISRNLFKKARLVKNNTGAPENYKFSDFIKYSSNYTQPYYLSGLKIQISGRLSQRKAASRTRIVRKSYGTLRLSSYNSVIDANKFEFKGKNGAITVKVWISSNPINSNTSSFLVQNRNLSNN